MNNNKIISPQRHEDTTNDLQRVAVANNNDQISMINEGGGPQRPQSQGRVGTPALPASAAAPYSSNSYLLTPNSSRQQPRSPVTCNLCPVTSSRRRRAAFSLAEILIAIFVLSIGLIMIAAVFPVAAKWTAQDAQTSVAQVIAKNAVAQIQAQGLIGLVPSGGFLGPYCYDFGSPSPYPNANPAPIPFAFTTPPQGSYYWSALILPATYTTGTYGPSTAGSSGTFPGMQANQYTIFVFVFNKGDASNLFATPKPPTTLVPMTPYPQNATYTDSAYPQLYSGTISSIIIGGGSPAMPIGSLGVDFTTGQVFREIVDPNTNEVTITGIPQSSATPNPELTAMGDNTIIYAPAAIGQTASPLIYVYVTTVSL